MINIQKNLVLIKQNISRICQKNARQAQAVKLLAVSKTKPENMIKQAYEAGQRDFGENYLQEALSKITSLAELTDITWHFIGPIQSNKTKQIAENFSWVHSVDRAKIAKRLNEQRRASEQAPLNICIQVNISEEDSKSGVSLSELPELAHEISQYKNIVLRGLMAIPNKDASKNTYLKMQTTFNSMQQQYPQMDTLSLGMSNDLNLAIEAGSTMVRIGTAIFGQRDKTETT